MGRDVGPCRRRRRRLAWASPGLAQARALPPNRTEAVTNMTGASSRDTTLRLAEHAGYLLEVAGRAPSVHNTQPWRFEVGEQAIELHADISRQLLEDPAGRE